MSHLAACSHRHARDDRELRRAADHRQQHRQRQHRRLLAPAGRAGDRDRPVHRRRLLRQGRGRRHGHARARRVPDARGAPRARSPPADARAPRPARSGWRACSRSAKPASATPPASSSTRWSTSPATRRTCPRARWCSPRAGDVAARFRARRPAARRPAGRRTQDLQASVGAGQRARRAHRADLNQQIAAALGTGHTPNDLLDQRDRLVGELQQARAGEHHRADDGTLGVFIAGGQRLVLGSQATHAAAVADAIRSGARRQRRHRRRRQRARRSPPRCSAAARIAGLLRFQNEDLADARNALGQLPRRWPRRVNEQQALGLDLRQPAGAGAPLFASARRGRLPAATNQRRRLAATSWPRVTLADRRLRASVQASDYELRADPAVAGNYLLTRRTDGLVRSIASGDVVDGLRITVGTPAARRRATASCCSR